MKKILKHVILLLCFIFLLLYYYNLNLFIDGKINFPNILLVFTYLFRDIIKFFFNVTQNFF